MASKQPIKHEPYTKLRAWMKENGVTSADFGELIGISAYNVNCRINGTGADFRVEEVRIICVHYGISADKYFVKNKVS